MSRVRRLLWVFLLASGVVAFVVMVIADDERLRARSQTGEVDVALVPAGGRT